jgi:hypothetical protein
MEKMKIKDYIPKMKCHKCKEEAQWCYSPHPDPDNYYCDDCIPRGCSCMRDLETDEFLTDDLGRPWPCCEYDYCEEGYDDD